MKNQDNSKESTFLADNIINQDQFTEASVLSAEKELIELETFCLDFVEANESDFFEIEDLHESFAYSIEA